MSQLPIREQSREFRDELEMLCARNLLAATDEIIYFKDLQSRFILLSQGWRAVTGRDPEELLGLTDFDLYGHDHAAAAYADEQRIIATGVPMVNKQEHETWPDRDDRWVTSTKVPLRDVDGEIIGTFGISRDITRLVEAEEQARRSADALTTAHTDLSRVEMQLRTVLDTSQDAIALYDAQLRYRYVNVAAERLLQQPSAALLGRTDRELGREETFLDVWEAGLKGVLTTDHDRTVDHAWGTGAAWRGFQSHLAPHRETVDGPTMGVVSATREVTELKRARDRLAHQAVHDPVTGLANRVLLMDRLEQALRRMLRHPEQVVLLFIDLDHFKEVNDTYGHRVGDQLLREVGRRLTGLSRPNDTVARFGGDEFVLLFDGLNKDEDAGGIAGRVVQSLSEPFVEEGGKQLSVTGSVGVMVSSNPNAQAEDLVRDADAAMYQAKGRGRDRFQFFDADLRARAAQRYALEVDLSRAVDRGEFRLEYQPVFCLGNQHLDGAEALIRWEHPARGCVPPGDFIEVAESRGLIVPIGTWVLDEACRQVAQWATLRPAGVAPMTVAVNVSGRQLRRREFADIVKETLVRHGLAPAQLCLEITETALLEEADEARAALGELSDLGVRIALDDFGTGYSSLAHLLEFPVDVVKIDRSFVDQMGRGNRGREIVAAVTAMAHVLGMTVVGEGIETAGQLKQLIDLTCDKGQGYLLARPLRPEAFAMLLQSHENRWPLA